MWPLKLSYHQRDWKKTTPQKSSNYRPIRLITPNKKKCKTVPKLFQIALYPKLSFFFFWKTPVGCLQRDLGAGIIESRSALEEEVYRSFVSAAVITGYTILRSSLLQASFAFIYSPAWPLLCCCPLITVPRSMVSSFLFTFSTSPAHGSFGRRGEFLISSESNGRPRIRLRGLLLTNVTMISRRLCIHSVVFLFIHTIYCVLWSTTDTTLYAVRTVTMVDLS